MNESKSLQNTGVKETVRQFLARDLAAGSGRAAAFGDTESLVERGVIDSLGIFKLVAFLEDAFRIRIGDDEIVQDNFRTIDSIESFVVEKLSRAGR